MSSGKRLLIVSIITFIIPIMLIVFLRDSLFKGVVATYEEAALNRYDYVEQWVSYDVIACLGCYAEETETTDFIETKHEYYYLIWMADGSIMPLSVSKKADREYLDALTDATYDYCDGKTKMIEMAPKTFVGMVTTQPNDARKYYDEALVYLGTTEAEGWTVRYELLDCTSSRAKNIAMVGAVTLVPILALAYSIFRIRKENEQIKHQEDYYLPK